MIHPEPMLISERAENVELAIEVLKGEDIELPGILSQGNETLMNIISG